MFFPRWLRNSKFAAKSPRPAGRARRVPYARPRLEPLEDRITPDVGDTLAAALNTHIGPSVGTYTMLSEHLGDGANGALDVDMYEFKAKAGEVLTATTSPAVGGVSMDTYLRLFDSNGNELTNNDDFGGTLYSRILNFTITSAGSYFVGVSGYPNTAYNPNTAGSGSAGSTGDYRLDLKLFVPTADAAGDTLATALATNLGPADGVYGVNGTIGDGLYLNNDVDLYKFTANAGQIVTAVTSLPSGGVPMDTVLRLFDANGTELTNNAFGNGSYSRFQYQVANSGTYYIGVSGYYNYYYNPTIANSGFNQFSLGDYHLDLSLATPVADAAGDTLAAAEVTNLTASTPFSTTGRIGDGLYPMKDVDLYSFQVSAGQVLTAITSLPTGGTPINDIHVRLFDSSGNQLTAYYYGYSSSSRIDYQFATAGTYYIGLSGEPNNNYNPNIGGSGTPYYAPAMGDYQINLSLVTPTADAAGDTLATAQVTNLAAGTSYSATGKIGDGLYPLNDVDLYQFQASAGQVFTAQTSLPTGGAYMTPIMRLFDSSGNQLGYNIYGYSQLQYQFATTGTYYIGVSGAYDYNYNPTVGGSGYNGSRGDYTLNLSLATPTADTAGDTLATAQATGLGPANGTFSATAHIGDGLYPLRDVDLYQIQATAGQGLIASTAQVSGGTFMFTDLRLFDSAGHQLAFNSLGNYPNAAFRYLFSTSGTYYVGVSSYYNSSYDPTNPVTSGGPVGTQGDYQLNLQLVTPAMDAEGDTLATALATGFGPTAGTYTHTANIGDNFFTNRDVDLYSFSATAGQRFSASMAAVTTNNTPLYYGLMRLFDSSGHQLWFGYSFGGIQNYTFTATGTYYLGISGWYNAYYDPTVAGSGYPAYYTGDYSLSMTLVMLTPDAEGDTIATAYATGLGPTAGTFSHTAKIGDGLYPQDDVDMYRIDVSALQLIRVMTSQPQGGAFLSPIVRLFDSSGNELAESDGGYYNANVTLEYQFTTAGTYYIGVSGYYNRYYNPNTANSGYQFAQTGDYTLGLTLITPTPDAEGDTIATAVATGLGSADGSYTHTAKIGDGQYFSKDVDLYQVNATAGQVLTVETSVPTGGTPFTAYLRLFDSSGNELTNGYDAFDYHVTTAGTYYIGVSGYPNFNYNPTVGGSGTPSFTPQTGDYTINLSLVTPVADAVGDTIATALDTRLGPNAGTYTMPRTFIGDGLYVSRDVDMYEFRVQAGQILTATTTLPTGGTPVDLVLRLFDASGNELAQAGTFTGNSDATLQYTFATHGIYYLGVSGAPNYYYDPNTAGSGPIGARGDYSLALDLVKLVKAPVGGGGQHIQQVTGHAVWTHTTGVPFGGQNVNQVSINAWLDASGTAHGTMTWTTVSHQLGDNGGSNGNGGNGQFKGLPFIMRVDTLIIIGNTIHVEGVLVRSGQAPGLIGERITWDIVLQSDGSELLNGVLTDGGNFTVH